MNPAVAHLVQHIEAAHLRQIDVQQDDIRLVLLDSGERFLAVSSLVHDVAALLEEADQQIANVLVIVYYQNVKAHRSSPKPPLTLATG